MTGKKRPRARRSARAPRRVDASPLRGLSAESSLRLHFELLRARRVEEKLAELYKEQEMRTPTHFSVGQEAVAVGMCAALRSDDVVFSGHRCHAHYLAKGGNLAALVAELYGRESGAARGRGGSVHLSDMSVGMVAASAILAQTIPVAVGSALAFQMDGSSRVAVTFFGDGAVDEGVFHESLNWAAVKRLPVVFVCENNLYATHSPLSVRLPRGTEIYRRARMYEIAAEKLDKIFEPYFTSKKRGTGLGLAIVKHNVELYGGTVRVESELGKGSRFILLFPAKTFIRAAS